MWSRRITPRPWGAFGIERSVCLSVCPIIIIKRSCLGYRHAGCLQVSHRRPPEMCGLRTRPRTDVDPPRFFYTVQLSSAGGGHIVSPPAGRYLVFMRTSASFDILVTANMNVVYRTAFHFYGSESVKGFMNNKEKLIIY